MKSTFWKIWDIAIIDNVFFYDNQESKIVFFPIYNNPNFYSLKITNKQLFKGRIIKIAFWIFVILFLSPILILTLPFILFFAVISIPWNIKFFKLLDRYIPGLTFKEISTWEWERLLKRNRDIRNGIKRQDGEEMEHCDYNQKVERDIKNETPKSKLTQTEKKNSGISNTVKDDKSSFSSKSIFDNYESVMDKFDKK